jgi:hypothetical protein
MKIGGGRYAKWSIVNPQEQRRTGETEKSPSLETAETSLSQWDGCHILIELFDPLFGNMVTKLFVAFPQERLVFTNQVITPVPEDYSLCFPASFVGFSTGTASLLLPACFIKRLQVSLNLT